MKAYRILDDFKEQLDFGIVCACCHVHFVINLTFKIFCKDFGNSRQTRGENSLPSLHAAGGHRQKKSTSLPDLQNGNVNFRCRHILPLVLPVGVYCQEKL